MENVNKKNYTEKLQFKKYFNIHSISNNKHMLNILLVDASDQSCQSVGTF